MQTRSKHGIFKPKVFTAYTDNKGVTTVTTVEPMSVTEALAIPEWHKAMEAEFKAILDKATWELIPYYTDKNLIQRKWVFG